MHGCSEEDCANLGGDDWSGSWKFYEQHGMHFCQRCSEHELHGCNEDDCASLGGDEWSTGWTCEVTVHECPPLYLFYDQNCGHEEHGPAWLLGSDEPDPTRTENLYNLGDENGCPNWINMASDAPTPFGVGAPGPKWISHDGSCTKQSGKHFDEARVCATEECPDEVGVNVDVTQDIFLRGFCDVEYPGKHCANGRYTYQGQTALEGRPWYRRAYDGEQTFERIRCECARCSQHEPHGCSQGMCAQFAEQDPSVMWRCDDPERPELCWCTRCSEHEVHGCGEEACAALGGDDWSANWHCNEHGCECRRCSEHEMHGCSEEACAALGGDDWSSSWRC
jgi:hypothetical protein